MKNLVLTLMVLLIAIGLAAPMVGGTFASFSDIEISEGNYLETADLDLKVAKCSCGCCCDFKDDPYVEPCFEIHIQESNTWQPNYGCGYGCGYDYGYGYGYGCGYDYGCGCGCGSSYFCQLTLWNAAKCEGDQCEHGIAYLHIKNVEGCLSDDLLVRVERWDSRGRCGGCYGGWVVVKDWTKIGCLECKQIELFTLYASETQKVRIGIWLPSCSHGYSVEWDMAFELLGDGFSDIETSHNYVTKGCKWGGCSHGFWKTHGGAWTWAPTGYHPTDDFDATFKCDAFAPDVTLMQALWFRGGNLKTLAREAVAALLNAAHPAVNYPLTVEAVIEKVQDAIESGDYGAAKREFAAYNNLGSLLCGW
jgi:hypothetical protein